MSTPFGTFVPRAQTTGDRLQARAVLGRPILVQVTGFDGAKQVTDQNTKANVIKPAVFVDVWDFLGGPAVPSLGIEVQLPNTVYIGTMWMSGAIVDNLKDYLGGPPMAVRVISKQGKNLYLAIVPLGDPQHDADPNGPMQLQQVAQAFQADPTRFERERQARVQAALQQQAQPVAQPQQGFLPQAQPSQPAQNGWAQQPVAQAPAPQFAQPAAPVQQWQQPAAAPAAFTQAPASAFQASPGQPSTQTPGFQQGWVQQWAPVAQVMEAPQFQQPTQLVNPAQGQAFVNGHQVPLAQGFPNQAPAPAQGMPGGMQVNNADVAQILAGLAGQQPQQ